jgi:hypothetical protein
MGCWRSPCRCKSEPGPGLVWNQRSARRIRRSWQVPQPEWPRTHSFRQPELSHSHREQWWPVPEQQPPSFRTDDATGGAGPTKREPQPGQPGHRGHRHSCR